MADLYSPFENSYDIVVCGGGPGGLVTALHLAKHYQGNKTVALFDKMDSWREPVLCAEAVSANGLHDQTEVDQAWIRSQVDGVQFVAPDRTIVEYTRKDCGYIIDRPLMHKGLAERCADAGVTCNFRAKVKSISRREDGHRKLIVLNNGEERCVSAEVVVDASGAGNKLDTGEGLVSGSFDLETAVFAVAEGIEHDTRFIQLYYHSEHFPHGYGWVFPRDGKTVNIGIVAGKKFNKELSPKKRFQRWAKELWPEVELGTIYGGPISCGQPLGGMAVEGLYKVGDAASTVNPLSRGGIIEAMKCGHAAARAIIDIYNGADEKARYAEYTKDWMEIHGDGHRRLHLAKEAFGSIPDKVFNKAAKKINRIPPEKRSLFRIFASTLMSSPMILWRMRSLLR